MRAQHQIASELHERICHDGGPGCPAEQAIHEDGPCSDAEDILAALREQSRLTRAQIVTELEDWAKRWPMNKSVVLRCAQEIRLALESQ